jgi:hypothetical protein
LTSDLLFHPPGRLNKGNRSRVVEMGHSLVTGMRKNLENSSAQMWWSEIGVTERFNRHQAFAYQYQQPFSICVRRMCGALNV